MLTLIACGGEDGGGSSASADGGAAADASGATGDPTLTVDGDAVSPSAESLSGWDEDQPERPLAAVDDGEQVTTFVENELLVSTDDDGELEGLIERYDAVVIDSVSAEEHGFDGLPGQHVLRIDPSSVDASGVEEDLAALQPEFGGELVFSSEDGLRLFAAVAAESRRGLEVDVNWLARPTTFNDRLSEEEPQSMGFRDAFGMKHLRSGGSQDTGVVEAWIALERAGKLSNRVRIGIIDGGFAENDDLTVGRSWSYKPIGNTSAMGARNPSQCTGGNPCPYHGTNVAHVAAGIPDNQFGSAGSGGPVADLSMRHVALDHGSIKRALLSLGQSAIVNMSFGGDYSTTWQVFTIGSYRDTVQEVGEDKLLVAAAGNDGDDMDGDGQVTAPCEFGNVFCIGALDDNANTAAGFSNHGGRVDLWAPGTNVRVGPDPSDSDTNTTKTKSGTSSASPFVAGVAALVKAADPGLGPRDVEDVLVATAHTTSGDAKVDAWVDARAAVLSVLPDNPPYVDITNPMDGAAFDEGAMVSLEASVDDLDTDVSEYDISWSYLDEDDVLHVLGSTASGDALVPGPLCAGTYDIQAKVDGPVSDTVTLHFEELPDDEAPAACAPAPDQISIDAPTDGATLVAGDIFSLRATVNHDPPLHEVTWREGGSGGRILGRGVESSTKLGPGTHTLWAGYGDASDTVSVNAEDTSNTAPSVFIASPEDGAFIADWDDPPMASVDLVANATDAEDSSLYGDSVVWYYRKEGSTSWREASVTGKVVTLELLDDNCRSTTYDIKVVGTDSGGLTDEDQITVRVDAVGC